MPLSGQTWDARRFAPQAALQPFRALLAELASRHEFPDMQELGDWVDATRETHAPELARLNFVELPKRARRAKRGVVSLDTLYDARIALRGEVPCLSRSYHDLFNALMFKAFPRSKRELHARQYRALSRWVEVGAEQLPGRRTREQDALTLFDEGGCVVVCPFQLRAEFARGTLLALAEPGAAARVVLFGHALFEHLTEGQVGLRSSARVLFIPEVPEGAHLLPIVDQFVLSLLHDPQRFGEPDADAVVFFDGSKITFRCRSNPPPRRAHPTSG